MKQAYLADAVSAEPASTGAASVGNPSDGDPANGVEATALGAYAMFQLFKELEARHRGWRPDARRGHADAGSRRRAGACRRGHRPRHGGGRCALSAAGSEPRRRGQRGHGAGQPRRRAREQPALHRQPASAHAVGWERFDTRLATTEFVDDAIAAIPGGLTLATRNEHLASNPPTNEAAVPAYVGEMIEVLEAAIVDGAPASRDTLDQLYDVLNAAIALKANRASPTFTGIARSSDASSGDESTRIATTNWVRDRDAVKANIGVRLSPAPRHSYDWGHSDDSTRIATTAWIAGFAFRGDSRRAFTAAGSHSYDWEWDTPNVWRRIGGRGR